MLFRSLRASLIPLCLRHTVQRGRVTILVYHDPKPDAFRRQLSVLLRLYSVVSLRDAVDALEAGSVRRLPKRPLVITFDDGHLGNYGLLPMLREYGVPATVFVCTGIVGTSDDFWFDAVDDSERYKRIPDAARLARLEHETGASVEVGERKRAALSWTELREMSSLVDAQSHTISHPILPWCEHDKAEREIAGSRVQLAEHLDGDVYAFAYPNGDYSDREIEMLRDAGYSVALTVDAGFNSPQTHRLRLRRLPVADDASASELIVKASGLWAFAMRALRRTRYGYHGGAVKDFGSYRDDHGAISSSVAR